jgi:predicted dehydrogenase
MAMARLRVAVIGVGHLGKEHARILASLPEVDLVGVADTNGEQAQAVARRCGTKAFSDFRQLLPLVDAVTVATPTFAHHAVAREFLQAGIPTMVEKPLAVNLAQCDDLVELSKRHGAILQVGHIERFNPALVDLERRKFRPKFVQGERLGTFSGRSLDIGVVLDLMIHDLDVLLAMVRSPVKAVEAVGVSLFGVHEDIANARLTFANGCVANLTASRASVKPRRKMNVWASEGYVSLDFQQRHATIIQPNQRVRQEGFDIRKLDLSMIGLLKEKLFGHYLEIREIDMKEGDQLTHELRHFVQCVQTKATPKVPGEDGRNAVDVATRILEKINSHQWEGTADGPVGPKQLPTPLGPLFMPGEAA